MTALLVAFRDALRVTWWECAARRHARLSAAHLDAVRVYAGRAERWRDRNEARR